MYKGEGETLWAAHDHHTPRGEKCLLKDVKRIPRKKYSRPVER